MKLKLYAPGRLVELLRKDVMGLRQPVRICQKTRVTKGRNGLETHLSALSTIARG